MSPGGATTNPPVTPMNPPPASSGMPTPMQPPPTGVPMTMTPTAPPMGTAGSAMGAAGSAMGAAGTGAMPPVVTGDEGVPEGAHCMSVAAWDTAWTAFEDEVLTLTNAARAKAATCGQYGDFDPAPPLAMNAMLRCSSRLHSKDMGEKNYFAHDNLDGLDPFKRMAAAGYMGFTMGENIAKGQQTPKEVVDGWMNSPGHCSNIMNADYTEIGVGYFQGMSTSTRFNSNKLWTQNFGAPRRR